MMMPTPPSPPISPGARNPPSAILVPVFSPPTPAPSPRSISPLSSKQPVRSDAISFNQDVLPSFSQLTASQQRHFITQLLDACNLNQLVHINTLIQPRLRRDFLRELPPEVALHVLSYIDDAKTLARGAQVSRFWRALLADDTTWKRICEQAGYGSPKPNNNVDWPRFRNVEGTRKLTEDLEELSRIPRRIECPTIRQLTHQYHYKLCYLTTQNWVRGGRILRTHNSSEDNGVVTSVAMDDEWIVAGLANHRIHVFSMRTGRLVRSLLGHTLGVWTLALVSRGGGMSNVDEEDGSQAQVTPGALRRAGDVYESSLGRTGPSDACNAFRGWGQSGAVVVSGGCDRDVKVWDVTNGACLHTLCGHTSTIRCLKVLNSRPVAVSGSRDGTLRVWNIARGRLMHILQGHTDSVRCLEVSGNMVVSGSYDKTCRLWNADTGECVNVFRGHYYEVYSVAFDGELVATGSLDSHVRIWSAATGDCIALLQGHTSLVGQIQLLGDALVTGGSDGRIIVYDTRTLETVHRLSAHDNSVTCLQFDQRYIVSGGSDGFVKMFDRKTGRLVREMTSPCEAVWRVSFREDRCVIMCRRGGRTIMEIWTFRPTDEELS